MNGVFVACNDSKYYSTTLFSFVVVIELDSVGSRLSGAINQTIFLTAARRVWPREGGVEIRLL
jgi:hypothetical protein